MVYRITISKARDNLNRLVKRAHQNKEYFILEKDGEPLAGIMDADELEDYLDLRDPKIQADIQKSVKEYRAGKGRPVEELIAQLTTVYNR